MEQRSWIPARTPPLPTYLARRVENAVRRCGALAARRGIDKVFEYELTLLELDAERVASRGDERGARELLVRASGLELALGRTAAKTP